MRELQRIFGMSGLLLLMMLFLTGCMSLPQEAQPAIVERLEVEHGLRFLEILAARRLWQPEQVALEGYDGVWCVTAYGENDEDEFEVYLWVARTGEKWSAMTASMAGFEKMGCLK